MGTIKSIVVISAMALLVACGNSPQQKKDIAEARYMEEQTKTMKQYKECIGKAKTDTQKLDACELLLKANTVSTTPAAGN